ncbi:Uncharacterised protein [Mycobacterium tuberculosis]|nr:Uncharacterised protein [Mycobacterium tuberculosis]
MAFGLQPRRVLMYRAADLVQDVLKLGRLRERPRPVMTGGVHGQLVGAHLTMVPLLSTDIC